MDFTPEQQQAINEEVNRRIASMEYSKQQQLDVINTQQANSLALQQSSQDAQRVLQAEQNAASLDMQLKTARLSAIQIAQNILVSNKNNLPVDERQLTPEEITAFADSLIAYIKA